MNPPITTLDPVSPPLNSKIILAQDGFTCSLLTLAPGDETPPREPNHGEETLLFVVEGEVTVRVAEVNTILSKDQALRIPQGKEHVIAAHRGSEAKLLQVGIPPRQIVTPQILSFSR